MKKKEKMLITNIVIFVFFVILSIISSSYYRFSYLVNKTLNVFLGIFIISFIGYFISFITSGIPSLIRKLLKKKTYFLNTFIFSLILMLDLILANLIFFEFDIFRLDEIFLVIVYIIKIILFLTAVPIHACLYDKIGFFYLDILRKIIEKIFKIKIISAKENINTEIKDAKNETGQVKSSEKKSSDFSIKVNSFFKNIQTKISNVFKVNKKIKIIIPIIIIGLIFVFIFGFIGYKILDSKFTSRIIDFQPTGLTAERTVIKAVFSSDIEFKNPDKPGKIFNIKPYQIPGVYKLEGRTVILIPDEDLPLSENFTVYVNPLFLKAKNKLRVKGGKFEFNTKMMEVNKTKFYFTVNEKTLETDELIGEINFSLPVDVESLVERVKVKMNKKELTVTNIEVSERPNIVYLKIRGFSQTDETQKINVVIDKGVLPIRGKRGLQKQFNKDIALKPVTRLEVESIETYPVVGNTYVTVKFNLPIEKNEFEKNILIEPNIPFKVSTEYRYAVIEADFKVNTSYIIKIKKGMSSTIGKTMKSLYSKEVSIHDMNPYVKFTSSGKILPLSNNLNVEFVTLNLDEVTLSVEKVYKNNLMQYLKLSNYDDNYYDRNRYDDYNSQRKFLYSKKLEIQGGDINAEVKNLVNLKKLFNSKYKGLYNLKLSDTKGYYNYSSMTVNITDMGLIIKNDGNTLTAYVVNILSLNPMPGVKLSLISKENQVIKEIYSNEEGKVVFENYKLTEENLIPYMIYAEKKDDFTFLPLNSNHLDYSTFNVSGKAFDENYLEAFIKTERGVYRPGEKVYSTLIVRKSNLTAPGEIPMFIKVLDPTGKNVFEDNIKLDNSGLQSIVIPTEYQYKTGGYTVQVYQDEEKMIGSANFKIEDFIPHKIEMKIDILEQKLDKVKFKVSSRELHGAPSGNLKVKCNVVFRSDRFIDKNYKDYSFYNREKEEFYQVSQDLGESKLDENGEKIYLVTLPKYIDPPSSIRALIYAEVFDSTGRPLSDAVVVDMHKYETYYGLKIEGKKPFTRDQQLKINYVALTHEGKLTESEDVNITIERKIWYSIFKKFTWTSKYESEYYNEIVFDKTLKINKKGIINFNPDKGGKYTVKISKKNGMSSTYSFHVYDKDKKEYRDMSEPYKLLLSLDKKNYVTGETAYLTVLSPFEGKAVLTIEREKIYNSRLIDLSGGKAVIPIKVTDDFVPNMYVTVMAYRKPSYDLMTLPPVSYGAINIEMDKSRISQEIIVNTKTKIRSSDGLNVNLNLPGGAGSKVIIAAVDEGILQLTNYSRPDPYDFFYRKRKLSVSTNTTLKDLLPDIAAYKKAFGGGFDGDIERRHLNPVVAKRIKSTSLYSGILQCDDNGNVSHTFKMNQFNGKLRVMVMSVSGKKFGSNQVHVTVSDPIVMVPGLPRFLAPKDICDVPVKIYNKTEKSGKIKIKVVTDGPVLLTGKKEYIVDMKKDEQKEIFIKLTGKNDAGVAKLKLYASGNNENSFHETEFAVRPAAPLYTSVDQGILKANKEVGLSFDKKYIKQGQYKSLIVSSNKIVKCFSALEYLITYPYGCTEQTVSKSFPMLGLKNIVSRTSVFGQNTYETNRGYLIDKYIDVSIKTVERRFQENGTFDFWDGSGHGYPFISDYACHFLIECKNNGYPVNDKVYSTILYMIGAETKEVKRGRLDRRFDNIENRETNAYRIFLRSLAGKPDYDNLKKYYDKLNDKKEKEKLLERERCFLAAAYAVAGDKDKAKAFLTNNYKIKTVLRLHSNSFESYIRNTALYLYALTYIDLNDSRINFLEDELFKQLTKKGHFGNTQDTAWALLALSRLYKVKEKPIKVELYKEEKIYKTFSEESQLFADELLSNNYLLKNIGDSECYYSFVSFGYPMQPDTEAVNSTLQVQKSYSTIDGHPVDIKSVKQGDQVVVTLNVHNLSSKKTRLENILLLDLLPAGFEIENLRLASRGNTPDLPKNNISIDYQDIRDDRIIISARKITDEIRFSYIVRAVTPGEYVIPQFQAEAMYDPEIYGRTQGGEKLIILKK